MLRVAVAGALGRMGRVAVNAVQTADGLEYVGGFARERMSGASIVSDLNALFDETKPDVLVDFTTHPSSVEISMNAVARGVRAVIGATGWTQAEIDALDAAASTAKIGAMIVPNFSLGALLMMHFSELAAALYPSVEIIELHHDKKKDAPSGTARLTAQKISAAGGPAEVPIHSVRMRGLLAHQEVLFGTEGELLTIRHDSLSRESFAPGIVAAVRHVMSLDRLIIGLPIRALHG